MTSYFMFSYGKVTPTHFEAGSTQRALADDAVGVRRLDNGVRNGEPEARTSRRGSVRWNRSKMTSRSSDGNTGSTVVNREHQPVSDDLHRHADAPSGAGELAGVVDEHADQPVD